MQVDTSTIMGPFEKRAVVWFEDRNIQRVVLTLKGEVIPYVSFEPGAYISLWGKTGEKAADEILLTNHAEGSLQIEGITSDLGGRIKWRLLTKEAGRVFLLHVEDLSRLPGDYSGHLYLKTNLPQKPLLTVLVNGFID
ncbi:MAG: hypothetical protein JRF59_10670 [Deltaproteobacteria bacterium]|nr:hypothetical protein [Deltaproteobacteria bacterium]MBW1949783.1 hypothetical protein [Deltaproteobacteria bacterium]MBW2009209.1 hypothetical protein [Deltaproteobacteria bacterium]MBW2103157.1 hypothetical protein [Deltaproteobacteria bacterium]MBW2348291.1 hypothetical protein [Deltaproteobacteria bacterium]